MQRHALIAALMAAGLMTACGGGGGSSTPDNGGGGNGGGTSTATTISLSGVAAKGLMAGAQVTAHKVNADGSVDDTPIAGPVPTGADGGYSLQVPTTKGQPYVIKVTATAGTTHLDEVTGQPEPLPAGFTMRSVQVAPETETATVTTSITPFTEMAVAAAVTAGGVTPTNVAQAKVAVTQLLGFDPASVSVKAADAANASDDEKKLALMLTAVAQMASTGALGCSGDDNGSKTKCVVETLAKAAKANSVKLEDSSGGETRDVSAALATAVNAVVTDDRLNKGVPASVLTTVVANLACSGDSCTAATSGGSTGGGTGPSGPSALQLAIVEAKLWLGQLAADWRVMFERDVAGTTPTAGTVNFEANRFALAMTGVQVPAEALLKDLGAIASCIDLYNDFKAGRVSNPARTGALDTTSSSGFTALAHQNLTGTACTVYQDDPGVTATPRASTSPDNANYIGVSAHFYFVRDAATGVVTRWRHGFALTPDAATPGTFAYASRARRSSTVENVELQESGYRGTITSSTNERGNITAFAMKGDLPGAFVADGNTLANHHMAVDVSGTRSSATLAPESTELSGSLVAYKDASTVDGTITIKSARVTNEPYAYDANFMPVRPGTAAAVNGSAGKLPSSLVLNLVYTNAGGEFEGSFSATEPVWDKSETNFVPTKWELKGALRTVEAGVAKEFINGAFTATASGYGNFIDHPGTPEGPENFFTIGASFVGQVTAPNRPLLELKVSATQKSHSDVTENIGMQYSAIVNGVPRSVVNLSTGAPDAEGNRSLTITELSTGLKLQREGTPNNRISQLTKGELLLGELDQATGRLTFVDGSFISLATGL